MAILWKLELDNSVASFSDGGEMLQCIEITVGTGDNCFFLSQHTYHQAAAKTVIWTTMKHSTSFTIYF